MNSIPFFSLGVLVTFIAKKIIKLRVVYIYTLGQKLRAYMYVTILTKKKKKLNNRILWPSLHELSSNQLIHQIFVEYLLCY